MPKFEKLPLSANLLNGKIRSRKKVYAIPGVNYMRMLERLDAFEASLIKVESSPVVILMTESQDISRIPEDFSIHEPVVMEKTVETVQVPISPQKQLEEPKESKELVKEQLQPPQLPEKQSSKRQKSKRLSDLFVSTATDLDTDLCDITSFLEHDTDILTLARISDSE